MLAKETITTILVVVLTALVTASLIYLTPLKWITFVEPTIDDIAAQEFYDAYIQDPEKYIFLDVRNEGAYDRLHAEGSELVPLHTLYNQRKNLPKSGQEIVLICSGGVASGVGYHYLQHHGFSNIKRVEGGIESWQEAGLPVHGHVNN